MRSTWVAAEGLLYADGPSYLGCFMPTARRIWAEGSLYGALRSAKKIPVWPATLVQVPAIQPESGSEAKPQWTPLNVVPPFRSDDPKNVLYVFGILFAQQLGELSIRVERKQYTRFG